MKQSATHRTLDILELLVGQPQGLGLGEVGGRLDIPKSITHRLLALLAERGFVRQDEATGHYVLTFKLALLGARHLVGIGLDDVAQPILDRLARATGELCRLAIVEGEGMVWVAKAQGARHGLRYDPDAGTQVVLHATATGKAWLATLPERDALRIVATTRFSTPEHFGPRVIRDLEAFKAELVRTRARGHGLALEEGEPGTAAVAVVVRASADPEAAAVGTLSVAGPLARFGEERRDHFVEELRDAAAELSALWPIRGTPTAEPARTSGPSAQEHKGGLSHVV